MRTNDLLLCLLTKWGRERAAASSLPSIRYTLAVVSTGKGIPNSQFVCSECRLLNWAAPGRVTGERQETPINRFADGVRGTSIKMGRATQFNKRAHPSLAEPGLEVNAQLSAIVCHHVVKLLNGAEMAPDLSCHCVVCTTATLFTVRKYLRTTHLFSVYTHSAGCRPSIRQRKVPRVLSCGALSFCEQRIYLLIS